MSELLTSLLSNPAVNDYLIILLLVAFAIHGFIRGFALGFIHLIWLGLAVVFAGVFYQSLSDNNFLWFLAGQHLLSFVLLFILFLIGKILFYKLVGKIATTQASPLNRWLAIFLVSIIVLTLSWVLANDPNYIGSLHNLISNEGLRLIASFLLSSLVIAAGVIIFVKILNIEVNTDRPCPLLASLIPLDAILNAQSVEGRANHIFGLVLGLLKGGIMAILFIIILHQYNFAAHGTIASSFVDMATAVQNALSHYLTFIKK